MHPLKRYLVAILAAPLAALTALTVAGDALAADAALIDAARKEGRVVWLTTQLVGELALPMAAAFKAHYGVEVTVSRAGSRAMAERVMQAERTGQNLVDVVDGRSSIAQMKRAGLLAAVDIANAARLAPGLTDVQKMWFATNVFTISAAVNTELVPEAIRPRSLEDLLQPHWVGRIGWSQQATLSSANGFTAAVLRHKGEDKGRAYLQLLSRQNIEGYDASSGQIIEKVIAGEAALALQVYAHQIAGGAGRSAPLAWVPLTPVTGSFVAVSATRRGAHPNAARLLIEFMLSRQGQEVIRDAELQPAVADVAPLDPGLAQGTGKLQSHYFSPEEVEAQMPAWVALRKSLFPER